MAEKRSITRRLKAETAELHQRVERHPFVAAALRGELGLEAYRGYLRALASIHEALEALLDGTGHATVAAVWRPGMARRKTLERDLARLPTPRGRGATAIALAGRAAAGVLSGRADADPVSLLGDLYVLEGSTRGAPIFRRAVLKSLGGRAEGASTYFDTSGPGWQRRWSDFAARLDAAVTREGEARSVLAGAQAAFAAIESLFDAGHGAGRHADDRAVGALNPEAGRHPIPQDPAELEAACRAGERCWRRYPYLEHRYGERGRRFTDSDGAWVAALAEQSQADLDRQLDWLARVLVSRGLPRLVMEDHLSLLAEELTAARPDRRRRFDRLAAAAARFAGDRHSRIPAERWRELQAWFAARVETLPDAAPFRDGLEGMTDLVLAAVADRRSGLPAGPASLLPWLLHDASLPRGWAEAIEELVARAERCEGAGG